MAHWFRTRRESHLWLAAFGWLTAIYASLAYVRAPTEYLRERNLLRLTVALVFLAVAVAIAAWAARRRPGPLEWSALAGAGLVYLVTLVAIKQHEERVHLLEYAVFAALVYGALRERLGASERGGGTPRRWGPALFAIVLTALAGWADEGLQALLPERVYDLEDAALNAFAGALAVASIVVAELARRRDMGRWEG